MASGLVVYSTSREVCMIRYFRSAVVALMAMSLLMLPGSPVRAAQDATPAAECVTTTPEENKELARAYWTEAVWGDQGKIAEVVAPDEVHHWGIAGTTTGFEEFRQRWGLFNDAFPDLRFTVGLVAAEGDLVATTWTATGTQAGEWQGIAPTNKEVTWKGINIFRIACGKIAESWGEANHLGLRAALGATDVPAFLAESSESGTPMAGSAAATPCASDTPEANLAVTKRWSDEVWNGQNLDVLEEIASPAIVHHGASFPDAHGVDELKQALSRQFEAFPDIQIAVDAAFADGDLVVVRWSGTGTNEGEFLSVAPSGKNVEFTGINIYRMACGQIVESWSEMNGLAVLQAIQGAAATPTA
jgi:predicted ester cyclase